MPLFNRKINIFLNIAVTAHDIQMMPKGAATLCAIRVLFVKKIASELTRILNDECKCDEYVHLHCLPILYE